MRVLSSAACRAGRERTINRCAVLADDASRVYAVSGGIGEDAKARRASQLFLGLLKRQAPTLRTLGSEADPPARRRQLLDAVERIGNKASLSIYRLAATSGRLAEVAATATFVALTDTGAVLAHVGDNAAFHLRGSHARQLTRYHAVTPGDEAGEGGLKPADPTSGAECVLTRAIGLLPGTEIDTAWLELAEGDRVLLASRGLLQRVNPKEAAQVVAGTASVGEASELLVSLASQRSAEGDLAAVVVQFGAVGAAATGGRAHAPAPALPSAPPIPARQLRLDSESQIEALRGLAMFDHLSFHEMLSVLRVVHEERYPAGSVVVEEGSAGDRLYVIAKGEVRVSKGGILLAKLGAGADFGALSFIDAGARSARVTVESPLSLLTIRRDDFVKQLATKDPHLAQRILWRICQNVASRLRKLSQDYVDVASGSYTDAASEARE